MLLVSGHARLTIEHQAERLLTAGDWVHIKAHVLHRVSFPDLSWPAVWLAVFVRT